MFPSQLNNLRARLDEADAPGARLQAHALRERRPRLRRKVCARSLWRWNGPGPPGSWTACGELLPRAVEEFERFKGTLERAGWV